MKLPTFGRKARAPAQAVRPGLSPFTVGTWNGNLGAPRSYEALVRDSYLKNPIAQRAVRIVAEGAAGSPVAPSPTSI